jgi:membrane protein implicated in regulation of membrane protease activity
MIAVPVEDLVFIVCALVGGALLLVLVIFDDILGGILDAIGLDIDVGGTSLAPLLIAFVAMFGVGGLFATRVLDVHGGAAAVVGAGFGGVGVALVYVLFSTFRRAEGHRPFGLDDLVGRQASVAVAIPAGRLGSVYVRAEGQNHEYSATATTDVPSGSSVKVIGVHGNGLVVAPIDAPGEPAER